jgi:hypothetical protein
MSGTKDNLCQIEIAQDLACRGTADKDIAQPPALAADVFKMRAAVTASIFVNVIAVSF